MNQRKSTGGIKKTATKKRTSKSVPQTVITRINPTSKNTTDLIQVENGNKVVRILTNLQKRISRLPIFASKVNVLTSHLNTILDIAKRYRKNISRTTYDFWSNWDSFSEDFNAYMDELTCQHCADITSKQLDLLDKYLQNIKEHPPRKSNPNFDSFANAFENLENDFNYLKNLAEEKLSEAKSEEEFVKNSHQLIEPITNLIQLLDQPEYNDIFSQSISTKKEAATLKSNIVHSLELILESIRGLTNAINTRLEITDKFEKSQTELSQIIPVAKKSLLYDPNTKVTKTSEQKKKREIRRKKLFSRREISLLLDERRRLLKRCGLPITIAEDEDKIMFEIKKRRKVLDQRETNAKTTAQKGEIAKSRELLKQLEQSLEDENKEDDALEETIDDLQRQLKELNANSDYKKQIEALRAQRDELKEKKEKAERRLAYLVNDNDDEAIDEQIEELQRQLDELDENSGSKKQINALKAQIDELKEKKEKPDEEISSLNERYEDFKEQLSTIKREQRALVDDMIKAKAQNDILASDQDAILENAKLRDQKLKLLNNVQQLREEAELFKTLKNKADHLALLPESSLMSNKELLNEYNSIIKAKGNLTNQLDDLKKSLKILEDRREHLIANSAKSELLASKYSSDKIEKVLLSKVEKVSNEYNEQKKKYYNDQLQKYRTQFETLKNQTDTKIMQIKEQENRKSKIDQKTYQDRINQESEQEIEVMKNETKKVEAFTREVKRMILKIQTQINEASVKKKAVKAQKLMIEQDQQESDLSAELDQQCKKNKELRLRYEEAKCQLNDIDEYLNPQLTDDDLSKIEGYQIEDEDENVNLFNILESIELKLSAIFDAQQAAIASKAKSKATKPKNQTKK